MNENFKLQHLLTSLFYFVLLINISCSNDDDTVTENETIDGLIIDKNTTNNSVVIDTNEDEDATITEDTSDTSYENEGTNTEVEIAINCSSTLGANYIVFEP